MASTRLWLGATKLEIELIFFFEGNLILNVFFISTRTEEELLEEFNVRVLYDKLEDQTLHIKSQLGKHQDRMQTFYEKINNQTEGLKVRNKTTCYNCFFCLITLFHPYFLVCFTNYSEFSLYTFSRILFSHREFICFILVV